MPLATVRQDGEEFPADPEDLRQDIRDGSVPADVLVRYAPWTGERFVPVGQIPELAEELVAPGALLTARLSRTTLPWAALGVTGAIVVAAVAQFAGWMPAAVYAEDSTDRVAIGFESVLFGRAWWAAVTSQLVHGDALHVVGNLAAIAVSGWRVERALGPTAYAVVAAASVLCGAALVVAVCPLPVIGSSTLGFGLLAAHMAVGFRYGDTLPIRARGKYGFGVLPILIVLAVPTLTFPAVAHSAHLGGLLGGGVAAFWVPADTTVAPPRRRRVQLRNLTVAAALLLVPALVTPVLARHPALVLGAGSEVEVEGTGVKLRLPWRVARNEGLLLGARAWSTSPGSPDTLFGGLNRARSVLDPDDLAGTWERGARLSLLPAPEPLGPGWVPTAFRRESDGGADLIVEHQQLRGTTLVRLGYMVKERADGTPGLRAALFERILRTAELGDPPRLAAARRKFAEFPEVGTHREELGKQLYLVGQYAEAEEVLAPLVDPRRLRGGDALRMRLDLWAHHPEAVRAVYGPELDPSWLEAVLDASASQRFYQDRGIRSLVAFGLCAEAEAALSRFRERRPDAPELEPLAAQVADCGDRPPVEPAP
jgi:membrane associated rhomboid family serine protease